MVFSKHKNIIFFILICLIVISICSYFYIFHGDLSNNQSDWGSFGSYIGGILTPMLTFITVVILIHSNQKQLEQFESQISLQEKALKVEKDAHQKQLEQFESQISLQEKALKVEKDAHQKQLEQFESQISLQKEANHINEIQVAIENIQSQINKILATPVPRHTLVTHYGLINKDYTFRREELTNSLVVIDVDGKETFIEEINALTFINGVIKERGLTDVMVNIIGPDRLNINHILKTFASQCDYLIGLVIKLKNRGVDIHALKYYLSVIYNYYELLHRLNFVSEQNYMNLLLLQNVGCEWETFKIKNGPILDIMAGSPQVKVSSEVKKNNFGIIVDGSRFYVINNKWVMDSGSE